MRKTSYLGRIRHGVRIDPRTLRQLIEPGLPNGKPSAVNVAARRSPACAARSVSTAPIVSRMTLSVMPAWETVAAVCRAQSVGPRDARPKGTGATSVIKSGSPQPTRYSLGSAASRCRPKCHDAQGDGKRAIRE